MEVHSDATMKAAGVLNMNLTKKRKFEAADWRRLR